MSRLRASLVVLMLIGCGGTSATVPSSNAPSSSSTADTLVGHVTRAEVEALPKWAVAKDSTETNPELEAAKALSSVPAGASVRVILGTWCGDSRREVTRFWKALDVAGAVPFSIEYVAVDRAKKTSDGSIDGVELRYVPTFIVLRNGKESGRVIESSPNGIERDLGALLRGEKTGVISRRTDVGA